MMLHELDADRFCSNCQFAFRKDIPLEQVMATECREISTAEYDAVMRRLRNEDRRNKR